MTWRHAMAFAAVLVVGLLVGRGVGQPLGTPAPHSNTMNNRWSVSPVRDADGFYVWDGWRAKVYRVQRGADARYTIEGPVHFPQVDR